MFLTSFPSDSPVFSAPITFISCYIYLHKREVESFLVVVAAWQAYVFLSE